MPIDFVCECGRRYHLPDSQAGHTGRCKCGNTFTVPSRSEAGGSPVLAKAVYVLIAFLAIAILFGLAYWLSTME